MPSEAIFALCLRNAAVSFAIRKPPLSHKPAKSDLLATLAHLLTRRGKSDGA